MYNGLFQDLNVLFQLPNFIELDHILLEIVMNVYRRFFKCIRKLLCLGIPEKIDFGLIQLKLMQQ